MGGGRSQDPAHKVSEEVKRRHAASNPHTPENYVSTRAASFSRSSANDAAPEQTASRRTRANCVAPLKAGPSRHGGRVELTEMHISLAPAAEEGTQRRESGWCVPLENVLAAEAVPGSQDVAGVAGGRVRVVTAGATAAPAGAHGAREGSAHRPVSTLLVTLRGDSAEAMGKKKVEFPDPRAAEDWRAALEHARAEREAALQRGARRAEDASRRRQKRGALRSHDSPRLAELTGAVMTTAPDERAAEEEEEEEQALGVFARQNGSAGQNGVNIALQEKFHRRISEGAGNISDTLSNKGTEGLL